MPFPPLDPTGETQFTGPINETKAPPYKLMIARFPGNNSEHPASSGWVMKTIEKIRDTEEMDESISAIVPHRISTTPITMGRNRTVWDAIGAECDYLLMIDSDMEPDYIPTAPGFWETAWGFMMNRRSRELEWYRLLRDKNSNIDFDVYWENFAPATIAAPYCIEPSKGGVTCVFQWVRKHGNNNDLDNKTRLSQIDRMDAYRRSGIGEVAAIGTGLILYDVRIFFYLPVPWFEYEYTSSYHVDICSGGSTEDVYQTRNASILGMPQYCAWDCWSGHWKLELIGKPDPLTVEILSANIRRAITQNLSARNKLHFVHEDAPLNGPDQSFKPAAQV